MPNKESIDKRSRYYDVLNVWRIFQGECCDSCILIWTLSVLLRFTPSDYPSVIFKLFFIIQDDDNTIKVSVYIGGFVLSELQCFALVKS
jgi:hypothetical protein